ncbi:uncharacterized protein [Globicephala melas]|uniref:uncharacterized protein n=1 Tax=Globicephala melas TaxID=9731 RepID=UPI003872B703
MELNEPSCDHEDDKDGVKEILVSQRYLQITVPALRCLYLCIFLCHSPCCSISSLSLDLNLACSSFRMSGSKHKSSSDVACTTVFFKALKADFLKVLPLSSKSFTPNLQGLLPLCFEISSISSEGFNSFLS